MQRKSGRYCRDDGRDPVPGKPGALSLIAHILRSLVSDGMQWLFIPAVLAVWYMQHVHFELDILPVLIFGVLGVMAVLNGCKAWQEDLYTYQRHLAMKRHLQAREEKPPLPGYYPDRRY